VDDRNESGGFPKVVGFQPDGTTGLQSNEAVGSCFAFDLGENRQPVVTTLSVHCNTGLGDRSHLRLPGKCATAYDVAGWVGVLHGEPDVPLVDQRFNRDCG
jgi:hypothetical protein